jgi:hypothetical protein
LYDPLVERWPCVVEDLPRTLPSPASFDALVCAVLHAEYQAIDLARGLGAARAAGCRCDSIGRGPTP